MLSVGFTELEKAFKLHKKNAHKGSDPSYSMIHFYCVECGFKSLYLQKMGFHSIDEITDKNLRKSHDLAIWAKLLKVPANAVGKQMGFRLKRDHENPKTVLHIVMAHQAWRYGIVIENNDEDQLRNILKSFELWIDQEMNC